MNGHEQEKLSSERSRLDEALDELDGRARRVMELWLEGRGFADIAGILGMTERTARVLRAAATRQMRQRIATRAAPDDRTAG